MDRLPTIVVGGGIGGLATALALAGTGRAVHVLEKAPEFGEIGAGLQLAPNAMHVLDQLGVMPAISKHAVYPARLVWMDALRAERITEVDLGDAFKRRFGHPYIVMHRGDLLNALLDGCKANRLITLESGRDVVAVEPAEESVKVRCADGTRLAAELLVGADGLHSTVRKLIVDDKPVYDGYIAFRGTIPIQQMSTHAGLDNVVMWVGPQMHFVQYPIRRGELYNQVAVFKSPSFGPGRTEFGSAAELDAHYAQTCEYIQGCIKVMWRDKHWTMIDRQPILKWTRGRVALLGDAAHPMYQYIAQGACQAIEDSLALAKCVAAGPLPAALQAYEKARVLRAARVQLTARAMGAFFHLEGVGAVVRNDIMAPRQSTDYAMLDWLYGHKV